MPARKLVAGNWKMNGLRSDRRMLETLAAELGGERACDVLICPPATMIAELAQAGLVPIGGQDCHWEAMGAHTGEISAEMLADAGAIAVILGHSERRAGNGERDETVARKCAAAWRAGLAPIVCLGETEAERDAGRTLARIGSQLAGSVPATLGEPGLTLAYEPVWAIGTGRTASVAEIAEVHDFLRGELISRFGNEAADATRLLYGGSVKPDNAAEIFAVANVDGALVGGASLKAADFAGIIAAA